MRVLLHLPRAIGNANGKRGAALARERQRSPQLLGHHTDELQAEGLRVAETEAVGETDACVTYPQSIVVGCGPQREVRALALRHFHRE
jgi:hypothetical protein